ncbi:tryptophan 7-halogenase [Rhodobacterales bacterium HKCCE3408]|nr:tryptophan 7-halogenase [Rhodobacterales bacterium HKCCE3408]
MGEPITNVTIVGGGTAGWLAALLLNTFVRAPANGPPLRITLIESPNVPTVGVGEATVPGMPRTLKTAGISERAFFKACNASFKLGVVFKDWNVDENGEPFSFINPFERVPTIGGLDFGYFHLRHGARGREFAQTYSPATDLARACRGPRPLGLKEYANPVGFAYHLDAGAFARMLQGICTDRGVRHIREDVVHVEQDPETGYVTALELKESGRHEVELVLDCTGFRGLIINEVLKEPFISYSKYLANDRAMAVQLPHKDPTKLPSATQSTALGAGWVWRVPLFHRVGTGYVYSSAHRTDEEARAEFLAHLGEPDAEPRVIPMRIGRTERAWVKNVVAVGLSGGFIEPLESTAIHTIDMAVRWLGTYFPDRDFAEPLRARYNKLSTALYDEIRDFICLHYVLGNRTDDPYWIDARSMEVPDSLAANLELWQHVLPSPYDLEFDSFFSHGVYQAVLLGKRVYEMGFGNPGIADSRPIDRAVWDGALDHAEKQIDKLVHDMADHHMLLKELRGELEPQMPFGTWGAAAATVPLPGMAAPRPTVSFETGSDPASLL